MSRIVDGWLLTLNNGQMIYCPESLLNSDREGNYRFDGDGVYFVMFAQQPNNQMQCLVIRPKRTPEKIAEVIIPKHGITKKERICDDSIIYTTIVKERSNIIIPNDVSIPKDATVQKNIHQG